MVPATGPGAVEAPTTNAPFRCNISFGEIPPLGGVTPWKGEVGNWRNYFSQYDEERFWMHGTAGMRLLGIEYDGCESGCRDGENVVAGVY